jgi:hypothetical protein
MSTSHTPLRRAALAEAARAAGAIDPNDVVALIPANELLHPTDAVAALRALRPHHFRAKQARDMSKAEYDAALTKLGVNPKTIRRHT